MLSLAILLVLPALIMAADPPANLEEKTFKALDGNGDGKITSAEQEAYFLGYDSNKDGNVSEQEFKAGLDKVDPIFVGKEHILFGLLDGNTDGKVNKTDLDAAFKFIDTNGDNIIERNEFSAVEVKYKQRESARLWASCIDIPEDFVIPCVHPWSEALSLPSSSRSVNQQT